MSKKKKKKLDEGMVMLSSMVPAGKKPTLSLRGDREDNFVFKGLPGQFDKDGNKVLDEYGDPIKEDVYFRAAADDGGDTKTYDEIMKHWKAMGASIDKLSRKEPKLAKELKKNWQAFGKKMSGM